MTLIDAGIPEYSFHIDAVDISKRALDKARTGIYTQSSFRGNELSFKDRFFKETPDGFRIHSSIKNMIHFKHANILEEDIFSEETVYDIIFCRNLLIYMNTANIQRVVNLLNRVLPENGMLFVGHVERQLINRPYFRWFRQPGVFACQKIQPVKPQVVEPPPKKIVTPASVEPVTKKKPVQQKTESKPLAENEKTPLSRVSIPKETPFEEKEINSRLERARILADRGSMDEAMKLCEEHLKHNAFDIQAHYLMGIIFHALDNEKKAEEHFLKAVYLDPNHHEALIHLSFIAEHRGESNKALHYKQRAERILQRESKI
jgi:chemotaxis protein methyltransferase WspC